MRRTSSTWIMTRSQNPARSCDVVWNCSLASCVYNVRTTTKCHHTGGPVWLRRQRQVWLIPPGAGCAGKTVLSLDNACYTWAPDVSYRGVIQIIIFTFVNISVLRRSHTGSTCIFFLLSPALNGNLAPTLPGYRTTRYYSHWLVPVCPSVCPSHSKRL